MNDLHIVAPNKPPLHTAFDNEKTMAATSNPVFSASARAVASAFLDGERRFVPQWAATEELRRNFIRVDAPAYNLSGNSHHLDSNVRATLDSYLKRVATPSSSVPTGLALFPGTFKTLPPVPPYRARLGEGDLPGEDIFDSLDSPYWAPHRVFGCSSPDNRLTISLAEGLWDHFRSSDPADRIAELESRLALGSSYILSAGTPEGFSARLYGYSKTEDKLTSAARTHLGESLASATRRVMKKRLRSSPVFTQFENALSVLSTVETNPTSGAGPLYGTSLKKEVMGKIELAIDLLHDQWSKGTVVDFLERHPIWYVSECKNKTDLYEIEKLQKKTRPYYHFNAHFAFLYSFLAQPWTEGMEVCTKTRNLENWNAYGHSWANKGAGNLMTLLLKSGARKSSRGWVALYGDDSLYAFPQTQKRGGVEQKGIEVIGPDVSQMDSTVSHTLIKTVIVVILEEYERQHPVSGFIRWVCDMWKYDACTPRIGCNGPTTYQLDKSAGLATGIVGTTLFDTVQAAIAAEIVFKMREGTTEPPMSTINKAYSACGMTVKPGTEITQFLPFKNFLEKDIIEKRNLLNWEGAKMSVLEVPFLGMEIAYARVASDDWGYVPYLTREGLWRSLLNPKTYSRKNSATQNSRGEFDSLRGLLLCTGGVLAPEWDAIMYVINRFPDEIVTMPVQCDSGRGEMLPLVGFENIHFVDSSGVPSPAWVMRLFAHDTCPEEAWLPLLKSREGLGFPYVNARPVETEVPPTALWTDDQLPEQPLDLDPSSMGPLDQKLPRALKIKSGPSDTSQEWLRVLNRAFSGPAMTLEVLSGLTGKPMRQTLAEAMRWGAWFDGDLLCRPHFSRDSSALPTTRFALRYPDFVDLLQGRRDIRVQRIPPPLGEPLIDEPAALPIAGDTEFLKLLDPNLEPKGEVPLWLHEEAKAQPRPVEFLSPTSLPIVWKLLVTSDGNAHHDIRQTWKQLLNASGIELTTEKEPYCVGGVTKVRVRYSSGAFRCRVDSQDSVCAERSLFGALTLLFWNYLAEAPILHAYRNHEKNRKIKLKAKAQKANAQDAQGVVDGEPHLQCGGGSDSGSGRTTQRLPEPRRPPRNPSGEDGSDILQVRSEVRQSGLLPVSGVQQLCRVPGPSIPIPREPDPPHISRGDGLTREELEGDPLPGQKPRYVERSPGSNSEQPRGVQPRCRSDGDSRQSDSRILCRPGHRSNRPRYPNSYDSLSVLERTPVPDVRGSRSGPILQPEGCPIVAGGQLQRDLRPIRAQSGVQQRRDLQQVYPGNPSDGRANCPPPLAGHAGGVLLPNRVPGTYRQSKGDVILDFREVAFESLSSRGRSRSPHQVGRSGGVHELLLGEAPPSVSDLPSPPSSWKLRPTRSDCREGDWPANYSREGPGVYRRRSPQPSKTAGIYNDRGVRMDFSARVLGPAYPARRADPRAYLRSGRRSRSRSAAGVSRCTRRAECTRSNAHVLCRPWTKRDSAPCLYCHSRFTTRTSADVLCDRCLSRGPPASFPSRQQPRPPPAARVQRQPRDRTAREGSDVQRRPQSSWSGDASGGEQYSQRKRRKRANRNRKRERGREEQRPGAGPPQSDRGGPHSDGGRVRTRVFEATVTQPRGPPVRVRQRRLPVDSVGRAFAERHPDQGDMPPPFCIPSRSPSRDRAEGPVRGPQRGVGRRALPV